MAAPTDLRRRLRARLVQAMKERDTVVVRVCRTALAAIENAEAVPVTVAPAAGAVEGSAVGVGAAEAPRRELGEPEVRAILAGEIVERQGAASGLAASRPDRAEELRHEAEVLQGLLDG